MSLNPLDHSRAVWLINHLVTLYIALMVTVLVALSIWDALAG